MSENETRVALITGAGRGIGRAIAERLAEDGLDIIVADIASARDNINDVVAAVEARGRRAVGATGDVSDPEDVARIVAEGTEALGNLGVFIANAGIAQVDEILDVKPEALDRIIDVNIKGVYYSYQAAARQFIAQGTGGKIIGAASIVAFRPFPVLASYSATKWAVRGLTQAAAMEFAKYNITVNAYAPGVVGTAMWDLIDERLTERDGTPRGSALQAQVDNILAGRVSEPADVAKLVSYLSGPDSDHMTGQTVLIDGGINFS
ncbi:SDR family NAD(P)-dependent oxidoreductase [Arthrobacter sp. zg-Y40]|uniref:SDR family NAD(P)-dependent oxidoreductase n=1 Tax=Arthrobacter sp. zg-Y40 TaxID=2886939 RepID=UPI001D136B16|nr:SDR family NAD(P)-dependent oxidoreductase [Arthrobacter sp. zg-Y40]MCC3280487.1 SDR family NAD(P)-dependent oxidoreductase [Arthrobacter sp. zg-Y40]